jgi:hypothetical protein
MLLALYTPLVSFQLQSPLSLKDSQESEVVVHWLTIIQAFKSRYHYYINTTSSCSTKPFFDLLTFFHSYLTTPFPLPLSSSNISSLLSGLLSAQGHFRVSASKIVNHGQTDRERAGAVDGTQED